ncbi:MAG: hypothetical protein ACP5JG_13330, partial [Anaerolineae bacterium]
MPVIAGSGPHNLLWTNYNPRPETICPRCKRMIGTVWAPGTEPALPLHPNCYCAYFPTSRPVSMPPPASRDTIPPEEWQAWVRYVAYLLLIGITLSPWLYIFREEAEEYNRKRKNKIPKEPPPMPNPKPSDAIRVATGKVLLTPRERSTDRREYWCSFMTAGKIKRADQSEAAWLIPPATIEAAAQLFDARPSYLDHPQLYGFGFHQQPEVKNLVGITFSPEYSTAESAAMGGLR